MSTQKQWLEDALKRAEKRFGPDNPYTKSLRTQLDGIEKEEKSAEQTCHSGRPLDPKE